MSQAVLAAMRNVSAKTVQSRELDVREPSDVALRMLQVIDEEPVVVERLFALAASSQEQNANRRRQAWKMMGRVRRQADRQVPLIRGQRPLAQERPEDRLRREHTAD